MHVLNSQFAITVTTDAEVADAAMRDMSADFGQPMAALQRTIDAVESADGDDDWMPDTGDTFGVEPALEEREPEYV